MNFSKMLKTQKALWRDKPGAYPPALPGASVHFPAPGPAGTLQARRHEKSSAQPVQLSHPAYPTQRCPWAASSCSASRQGWLRPPCTRNCSFNYELFFRAGRGSAKEEMPMLATPAGLDTWSVRAAVVLGQGRALRHSPPPTLSWSSPALL